VLLLLLLLLARAPPGTKTARQGMYYSLARSPLRLPGSADIIMYNSV